MRMISRVLDTIIQRERFFICSPCEARAAPVARTGAAHGHPASVSSFSGVFNVSIRENVVESEIVNQHDESRNGFSDNWLCMRERAEPNLDQEG